jgi:hypothetical protein
MRMSQSAGRLFLVLATLLALGAPDGARAQSIAINPSAAASDIRNPSSMNPAAAASDIRNPSAINPAAAASDIRAPGVVAPSRPANVVPRVARPRIMPPERPSRTFERPRRGRAAARRSARRERAGEVRPRPASPAEREASAIMGSVCRGC